MTVTQRLGNGLIYAFNSLIWSGVLIGLALLLNALGMITEVYVGFWGIGFGVNYTLDRSAQIFGIIPYWVISFFVLLFIIGSLIDEDESKSLPEDELREMGIDV